MGDLLASGIKAQVIEFLSRKWPLSAKSIHLHVRKQKACSYQAVHKVLQEMLREGVLMKQGRDYALNLDWIKRLKSTTEILERTYANQETIAYPKTYVFTTAIAMGRFIINKFIRLKNPENKVSVCRWRHMHSLIGLSKEEIASLKKSAAQTQYYIVSQKNSPFDRFLLQAYADLGGRVRLQVDGVGDPDVFVHGDYIAQVHLPAEYHQEWDKIHLTYGTPAFDMRDIIRIMHEKKWRILVNVSKDQVLADQLRMETMKCFTQQSAPLTVITNGAEHAGNMASFFKISTSWKELSHDSGLPYTFYSGDPEEFMRVSEIIKGHRVHHAEGIVQHHNDIFEFFKKRNVRWIAQWEGLRWHYSLFKKKLGDATARALLQNPVYHKQKYGVETRILRKSLPFSLGIFDGGVCMLYPREKAIAGFSSHDQKLARTFERIFDEYWAEAEPYDARRVLQELERR